MAENQIIILGAICAYFLFMIMIGFMTVVPVAVSFVLTTFSIFILPRFLKKKS